ncbi:MAG TPA: TIGR02302 family protein [Xanthobacteraceae bacterium]|nr:TIGR02302 family protein [Xanthobacteraceae bacterium]
MGEPIAEGTKNDQGVIRPGEAALARALTRARWAIFWERLWPALASIATAAGLFVALSWLGLWLWLPPLGRPIGLFVFFVLAVAATLPLARVRWPSAAEGLRRLDRHSLLPHRPATAIADTMAPEAGDSFAVALWRAHLERALRAAAALKAGTPQPRLAARDPWALRGLVVLLLAATFFSAGGERVQRIAAAFDWQGMGGVANYRVDAWVAPPAYTGRPPVMLPGLRPGEPMPTHARGDEPITVPANSTLVVRATGQSGLDIRVTGGVTEAKPDSAQPQAPKGTEERQFTIVAAGSATVRAGENVTWRFNAIPDRVPTIALTKEPEAQLRGSLLLHYKVEDDYGVVDARATFARKPPAAQPALGGAESKPPRPLFDAPDFALSLPQARTRSGASQITKDLSEHPWSGVDVTMTLTARDEAGQEGRSAPQEMRLPQRPFSKPLPRALIEQRRLLALDANAKDEVLTALDALTIAPERFMPNASIYLGLRSIYWQLANAENDDALRDVVGRLWSMAVQLEDGNISEAEKALRAAQDALRDALERGASDEEIKRLMDNLRAALDKFMQSLAEEMRKNPQMARPLDQNAMRELRPQDLRSMLDRMERLARSGARDAAKQMLDQLRQMLENLQMARPNGQQGDDMQSALDELGDMIRKQQQLRDRTFRQGQEQRRQRGPQDQNAMNGLRRDQQALRDQLNKLLDALRKQGFPQQGQKGQDGQEGQQGQQDGGMDQFGQAGEAMGDAQGSLGEGDADSAVDSQGRALEALRKGAQGMAQSMQQQMGNGPGPGEPGGRMGPSRADQNTDPLGRPLRGRDYGDDTTVKVPGEIDVQRARRILEELRKRFGESYRPQLELDYIERLLKDY